MPDIIANGLEIEASIDQALHTGMTQGVGAGAGDRNPSFAQIACAPLGNSDPGDRSVRGVRLKEQACARTSAGRPCRRYSTKASPTRGDRG